MSKPSRGPDVSEARRARVAARLNRRHRKERLFKAAGLAAVAAGLTFLTIILGSLILEGATAFTQTKLDLPVRFDEAILGDDMAELADANYDAIVLASLGELLDIQPGRSERREMMQIVSIDAAFVVRDTLLADPDLLGASRVVRVPASASVDMLVKGSLPRDLAPSARPLSDRQIAWIDSLESAGYLERRFNTALFTNGDSREPELAGIRGALMGSFLMLIVTLAIAFPIGVASAIYLEEFAPKSRWADLVEISINNLAAVPSIVFGLLGLAVFIDWLGFPRSAPLVGGFVLGLLTLPVVIISARAAIRSVPPSIREASLGLGASRMQVVFDHVLPLALPGIVTGTIIGMSRALGETAPLLMIGMVAFIVDVPQSLSDPATALPVQIYLWADSPERAFAERTSAAILVLLSFLLLMNLLAVMIRHRMERK